MKKEKWYMVGDDPLEALNTIEGIRLQGSRLERFSTVCMEYFQSTPLDRFQLLLDKKAISPYSPKDHELEVLYTCYPAAVPKGAKFKAKPDGIMSYKRAWYMVGDNIPYGLAALVDIEGVCQAGNIAMAGDIVPAAFFAALSLEQFSHLESYGLVSEAALEKLAPDVRTRYKAKGFVTRYSPDRYEIQGLYEKYPAMNPDQAAKQPIPISDSEEGD